jgi:DNA-binding CsgD family transcriptional regulator
MSAVAAARAALQSARWSEVVEALAGTALDAEGHELLAEARWWLADAPGAIAAWEDAYRAHQKAGCRDDAARLASWVAREYAMVGHREAAAGWLARAARLASDPSAGWLALARSLVADDAEEQARLAADALRAARDAADRDLEIVALARAGLAAIRAGALGDGLARFDEALAAATGGEASRLRTVGEVCCDLVLATELTGDVERFARWMDVVEDFVARRGYPAIMGFCATCCAEADAAEGDFGGAEQQLRAAVVSLHETGHTARCVPPAPKLAELLVLQGRLEEAEQVLAGDAGSESLVARARLALARGNASEAVAAATRATRRLAGDPLVTLAAQALLVDAHLAAGDVDAAARAAGALGERAAASTSARAHARAEIAAGRVALARGDETAAGASFEAALDRLAGVQGSVEGAEAHLELARLYAAADPAVARAEAAAALRAFESVGASHGADAAAALLRSLGDRSRVGPKGLDRLTKREREVLRLVGQGLTNAEVADRLFISVKTAGNHVSSVLSKLGLRSRVEAATYATLHLPR